METSEECLGSDPCLGDPNNPTMGDCMSCWDFMRVELFVDNIKITEELIGENGTTDIEQNGSFLSPTFYTENNQNAELKISNLNWASDETNEYSNVYLLCYTNECTGTSTTELEIGSDIFIYPNPVFDYTRIVLNNYVYKNYN